MEAFRQLPPRDVQLETADATYFYFKADILAQQITYSTDKRLAANLVTISVQRAHQIIELNKAGERPLYLEEQGPQEPQRPIDLVEQEDLTRFDRNRKKKIRKQRDRNERPSRGNQPIEGSANDGQPTEHNDNNERNNRRSNDRRGNNRTRYRNRPGAGDEAK